MPLLTDVIAGISDQRLRAISDLTRRSKKASLFDDLVDEREQLVQ
jgi:hypothetical protein